MNESERQKYKTRLLQEKERLGSQISRLAEAETSKAMSDSIGELSMYDNHPADIGDELFERSKDMALRENEELLLAEVETALEKLSAGNYGICDACGQEITKERLNAIPWASKCLSCQQASDHPDSTPRPLEEELLEPPFQRTFLDRTEFNSFDGEDALQAVMRFGSSDTPQDIPGTDDYQTLFPNSNNEHQGLVEKTDAIPNQTTEKRK
ncbi:TraR/DksA C4-type zinc finger protein [Propionispora hippei]|uniref:Transcriptional regulator, TraR/DksA family n=1 Tax=Propionispora hippei DSM 15287 TaxID=1123003 RepID=A0A1M6AXZ8_9FIRM|nr:TraR/DksA C4-type zinc finger protein [Propionispora hippei]SHI41093.1 transcriptional regulator, TraR/DksA family [Propionispora hippei DSM 15287]